MNGLRCPDPDRLMGFLEGSFASETEERGWLEHVASCNECRKQLVLDEKLRLYFQKVPVPALSSEFKGRLDGLLQMQRARTRASGLKRRLLQGYWLAALALTYVILSSLEGPATAPELSVVILISCLSLFIALVTLVMRQGRLGISELVLHLVIEPDF